MKPARNIPIEFTVDGTAIIGLWDGVAYYGYNYGPYAPLHVGKWRYVETEGMTGSTPEDGEIVAYGVECFHIRDVDFRIGRYSESEGAIRDIKINGLYMEVSKTTEWARFVPAGEWVEA